MPAPTLHHPRTQINPSEEDELRRLEGAPPPSIDLTDDGPPEPAMACPCGLGQCTLITAKTEKNMGKKVPCLAGALRHPTSSNTLG